MTNLEHYKVGEWIPCGERLPENAKGAFCPRYQVMPNGCGNI